MDLTRRDLLAAGAVLATASGSPLLSAPPAPANAEVFSDKSFRSPLTRFVASFMSAMNTPGLTFAVTGRNGGAYTANFGYSDLMARTAIRPDELFQIGSITKSFVAILILQLQDEGKLGVHDPILHHLPQLPIESDRGVVEIHHLLSHTSGYARNDPLFTGDGDALARQAFEPGTRFHYSNWAYRALGILIEQVTDQPFSNVLSRKLLEPLGMRSTAPQIRSSMRNRMVASYVPRHDDRPYPRHGPLSPAGLTTETGAAGCIASTASDMARYMQMLLNRGSATGGRVLSEKAFDQFCTSYIAAPEFGPETGYGYGIAVYPYMGHRWLRHSGGMPSFRSAMHLDLDAGFAAFASINTNQGYGPTSVTRYALELLRAAQERARPPPMPPPDEAAMIALPQDFVGTYISAEGRKLRIAFEDENLVLHGNEVRVSLQRLAGDQFVADHPRFDLFPIFFNRDHGVAQSSIVELCHGADAYLREGQAPVASLADSEQIAPCPGLYAGENPERAPIRVVARHGQIWFDGIMPMQSVGQWRFRPLEEPWSPECAQFSQIVNGKAQVLRFEAIDRYRIGDYDTR